MKFVLEIDCGNAAFDDEPAVEVGRILKIVSGQIQAGALFDFAHSIIIDVNGNRVGKWEFLT